MKLLISNNAELIIQANEKKNDYDDVLAIAELMVKSEWVDIVIASAGDEDGGWVHLCARWNHFQKAEIREAFNNAKTEYYKR